MTVLKYVGLYIVVGFLVEGFSRGVVMMVFGVAMEMVTGQSPSREFRQSRWDVLEGVVAWPVTALMQTAKGLYAILGDLIGHPTEDRAGEHHQDTNSL